MAFDRGDLIIDLLAFLESCTVAALNRFPIITSDYILLVIVCDIITDRKMS